MCARSCARSRSKRVRRTITWRRWSMKSCSACFRLKTTGRPSTMASMIAPKVDCSEVLLYRLFSTVNTRASRLSSMTTRMPWRSDSSRRSAIPSSRRSETSSAIFATSVALLTAYGSSSMMIRSRPLGACSNVWRARTTMRPCLGVTHRRRGIAVDAAEVALAVDQRIAKRERLRHAHEGVVDRCLAVRVIELENVADEGSALAVPAAGSRAGPVHRVEDAALNGLQPITHVGQSPADDDGHGVLHVGGLHLLLETPAKHRPYRVF